jgi:hypothetical protein
MTTTAAQINIPFELLAEAVTTLNIEHKIKLWKLLGQEIAEAQRVSPSKINTSIIDSLTQAVNKVLLESHMTEEQLAEAFVNQKS